MAGALRYRMDMGRGEEIRGMMLVKVVLLIVLLILALIFAYFNLQSVKVSFFRFSYEVPLFLTVFASFIMGFLIAYIVSEIKGLKWKRYSEKLSKALESLWTGYPEKARGELAKLIDREEVTPLYAKAMKELEREASVYLQRYSLGIVETTIAEDVFRRDIDRAQDLLEKALGKNWKNLKALRMLRSVYYMRGEQEKAIDLQRKLIQESEKPLKELEKKVLASMLAQSKGVDALKEIEALPLTPSSLAILCSHPEGKERRKAAALMFQEGMQNEALLVIISKNLLTPEVIEKVEENRDKVDVSVLALLYLSVGMYEKFNELKDYLPAPIKNLTSKGYGEDRECYRELLSLVRLLECEECGKEYSHYSPLCVNCLNWNKLKTKGGS